MSENKNTYKNLKKKKNISMVFSIICTWGPILAFIIYALAAGKAKSSYSFGAIGIIGASIGLISAIGKYHWRTPIFILLLALYFVLDGFLIPIAIIGGATALDEMIFNPLTIHYKNRCKIVKEIANYGQ